MNASDLIEQGRARLVRARAVMSRTGDERDQATELLEAVLGHAPRPRERVPPHAQRRYSSFIDRRASGEPIAYIIGSIEFLGRRFAVAPGAFVPRYTTEFLAKEAIKRLRRRAHPVAVDVACGVAPVGISAAAEVPHAEVYATDISERAVALARRNARAHGLGNVRVLRSDLFSALPASVRGTVDVITSHPPYVPKHEVRDLPDELRNHEPAVSLTDGSSDGLGLARAVVEHARDWLAPDGWLLIEIGISSARDLRRAVVAAGYRDVASLQPPYRYTRVIAGRRGR